MVSIFQNQKWYDTKISIALFTLQLESRFYFALSYPTVSELAGIQCFHCSDSLRQVWDPNTSRTLPNHYNGCGTLRSIQRFDCPGMDTCRKVTIFYEHPGSSEVKEVVTRACWDTKKETWSRNRSTQNCYSDLNMSPPHRSEICLCDKSFCNTETHQSQNLFQVCVALAISGLLRMMLSE